MKYFSFLLLFCFVFFNIGLTAVLEGKTIKIYLDADRTNHKESALSMEMGIKTAFSEVNFEVQGYKFEFVPKDHRGNTVRSKLHMSDYLKDKQALFILGGLHSPPYIKFRDYINAQGILLLVPWAAGGPITRHPSAENWVFRLSVDDTKAGFRMADYAINTKKCRSPHLLLESTAWGESNLKTMTGAIKEGLGIEPRVTWFNWNTKKDGARIKLRGIISGDSDCILFVGNALEGAEFINALASLEKKVPIISHWGITGGNFHETVKEEVRSQIDLSFIQTCFSFVSSEPTKLSRAVFKRAQTLFPQIKTVKDIPAPTGFIHSYDLGRIVIAALGQIKLGDDMEANRDKLRLALENLKTPVSGLIKEYKLPFSTFDEKNSDAHEALGLNDFCMGKYGAEGEVILPYLNR